MNCALDSARISAPVERAEIKFLLSCVRIDESPDTADYTGVLIREGLDWEHLLRAAHAHGVAPLLYRRLDGVHSEEVPKDVLVRLRNRFHANRLHNLIMTGELLKLLDELEARSIPALPYKGPVLSTFAYGDLALREFGDLDVLVRQEDVLEAREVLTSLGYHPEYQMTRAQEAAFIQYDRECSYARDDGSAVELHWTVAQRYISLPLGFEYLWERAGQVPLGGRTVPSFSVEDLLLILCVHGGTHFWARLSWIRDVAELVRVCGESFNWERLLERADALSSRRMLLLGLYLANDMLGAELPEEVLRAASADVAVRALAKDVRDRVFSKDPIPQGILGIPAFQRFHLRMMDRTQNRLRYLIYRAMAPTVQEWEILPLPADLFLFYYLLRPIRMTGSLVRRKLARPPV